MLSAFGAIDLNPPPRRLGSRSSHPPAAGCPDPPGRDNVYDLRPDRPCHSAFGHRSGPRTLTDGQRWTVGRLFTASWAKTSGLLKPEQPGREAPTVHGPQKDVATEEDPFRLNPPPLEEFLRVAIGPKGGKKQYRQ